MAHSPVSDSSPTASIFRGCFYSSWLPYWRRACLSCGRGLSHRGLEKRGLRNQNQSIDLSEEGPDKGRIGLTNETESRRSAPLLAKRWRAFVTRRAVKSVPKVNRKTGPKLLAAAIPTKKSPGTEDSKPVETSGVCSTARSCEQISGLRKFSRRRSTR